MGANLSNIQVLIGSDFPKEIIPAIDLATKSLEIIVFDWRWYENDIGASVSLFNQAIVRASRRGVKVRALVNYPPIIETLKVNGCDARRVDDKALLHAKLMVIDRNSVAVGSHNYTQRAFNLNYECSVLIKEETVAGQFGAYFDRLWRV